MALNEHTLLGKKDNTFIVLKNIPSIIVLRESPKRAHNETKSSYKTFHQHGTKKKTRPSTEFIFSKNFPPSRSRSLKYLLPKIVWKLFAAEFVCLLHFQIDYVLTERLCGYVINFCFATKHLRLHNTHIKDTMLKSWRI